jgi:nudix-type nucleoside diphosphatase (YffH/AdpP family)
VAAAEILSTETRFEGWNRLVLVTLRTAGGAVIERSVEDHGSAVSVLPYDPERRTALLVRQLRVPMLLAHDMATTLEAPAGIRETEDVEGCARREVMEETGTELGPLEKIADVQTIPGVSTETIALFLAPYTAAGRVGAGGGLEAEAEEIEVVELPLAELAAMADSGRLPDLKTLALVQTLRLRRPELFGAD